MFKLMGIIEYREKGKRKVKIVGNKDGLIVRDVSDHPGGKLKYKQIEDMIGDKTKLKTNDIVIPKHIKDVLKEKE